jgi:hypothetical protein
MHPLLRTLDWTAGSGREPTVHDLHPIRDHASFVPRSVPALLSLGLTPILVYGLSLSLDPSSALNEALEAGKPAGRSVAFLLREPDLMATGATIRPPHRA